MVKRLETISPNVKSAAEYEKVYSRTYSKLYGLCKTLREEEEKEEKEEKDAIDENAAPAKKRKTTTSGGDATKTTSALFKIAPSLLAAPDHANLISATSIALAASAERPLARRTRPRQRCPRSWWCTVGHPPFASSLSTAFAAYARACSRWRLGSSKQLSFPVITSS